MLEDTKTIAKSIAQIDEIATALGNGEISGTGLNQVARWVTTKEDHATKIQHVMGEYFFAQRIKSDNDAYDAQLKAAHKVIVDAMKCKQAADPETAETLKQSILDFYEAYEGKKADFLTDENAGTTHVHATNAAHSHRATPESK